MSRKVVSILLLWSALLAATCMASGQNANQSFRFAVYGDCRDGHEVHRKLVTQMLLLKPAFIVGAGDYVNRGDNEPEWQIFADITHRMRQSVPFQPARGNHDVEREGKGLYQKYLNLRTNTGHFYYSFDYGNSHFIVLDTNSSLATDGQQYQWLLADLKATEGKFRHRFAVFHHPLFTLMPSRKGRAERLREKLHSLLVSARLCAVFVGHDHHFYLTKRDGVTHVTTGGGGAPLYEIDSNLAQPGDKWKKHHRFVWVQVSPGQAKGDVRDTKGKVMEEFIICSHP